MSTWTTKEINRLRDLYPTTPAGEVARLLGRTVDAVRCKAGALKIRNVGRATGRTTAQLPQIRIPVYPAADYCAGCGLSRRHLPGCDGTAGRRHSATWRRVP